MRVLEAIAEAYLKIGYGRKHLLGVAFLYEKLLFLLPFVREVPMIP